MLVRVNDWVAHANLRVSYQSVDLWLIPIGPGHASYLTSFDCQIRAHSGERLHQ